MAVTEALSLSAAEIAPTDKWWVVLLVALVPLAGTIWTRRRASRTEERGQDLAREARIGQEWERLNSGLAARVFALETRADKLEGEKEDQQKQLDDQQTQITFLRSKLAEWREYGLSLGRKLTDLGHIPPTPPTD